MDIYINFFNRVSIVGQDNILLKDIGAVNNEAKYLEELVVKTVTKKTSTVFLVDVIQVVNAIKKYDKNLVVHHIGESEVIVEYYTTEKKEIKVINFLKLAFVSIILFGGSATTIMAFHNETGLPIIFDNYFKMFYGYESKNAAIIDIPYSIGLAIGIIGFFNHILGKDFSQQPTPIEVEMNKYNTDLNEAEKKIIGDDNSD